MEDFYEFCGLQRQAKLRQEAEHHRLLQELAANHSQSSQLVNWLERGRVGQSFVLRWLHPMVARLRSYQASGEKSVEY
jgi:predicted NAD/FAD-binding protein